MTIGLAVSGGADSTALALLLAPLRRELGFTCHVLHVDHGLRPDSAADARFVRALARRLDMPFHVLHAKVRRRRGESIEMAARRVRLAFFAKMSKKLKLDAIATGHHADDVAETFLMRLARGSGAEGLAGPKRVSHVDGMTFIRPLLDVRDAQLKEFLRERGEPWREDSTNSDISILRNKVRHVVLPWLRENFDPRITEHLCRSAAILRGDGDSLPRRNAARPANASRPSAAGMGKPPRYVLSVSPSTGYERVPGEIGKFPAIAYMSRRALAGRTLEIRAWRAGDRIAPTGLGGHTRKLQDVFVTAKTPKAVRGTLPVLADAATGEVLWVPGYRTAVAAAVESDASASWRFELRPERASRLPK